MTQSKQPPAKPGRFTILLDVAAAKNDPARVRLKAAEITRKMLGKIPDRLADLLDIACYVYCADQLTRRDTKLMARLGGDWQRDFRFTIAVRDLAFWSNPEVLSQIESTLTFLSDDRFAFAFKATRRVSPPQEYLDLSGAGPPPSFVPDRVVLFSGGLDSFAGATEALIGQNERVVLVSHRSSPFVAGRQATLLDGLRKRVDPARLFRLSVEVTKGGNQAVEFTQRTRSFLFATIGFIVARMFGKREVTFYENGVVSMNLPLAPHVLGRGTVVSSPCSRAAARTCASISFTSGASIAVQAVGAGTAIDVEQRLYAIKQEQGGYGYGADDELKEASFEAYRQVKATGTEFIAILGWLEEWTWGAEERLRRKREIDRREQIAADKRNAELRLRSGADCPWTQIAGDADLHSRKNNRLFRLREIKKSTSPLAPKFEVLEVTTLDAKRGTQIGQYRTRSDASKAVMEVAYKPDWR